MAMGAMIDWRKRGMAGGGVMLEWRQKRHGCGGYTGLKTEEAWPKELWWTEDRKGMAMGSMLDWRQKRHDHGTMLNWRQKRHGPRGLRWTKDRRGMAIGSMLDGRNKRHCRLTEERSCMIQRHQHIPMSCLVWCDKTKQHRPECIELFVECSKGSVWSSTVRKF